MPPRRSRASRPTSSRPPASRPRLPGSSPAALLRSRTATELKVQLCEMGRRCWQREFTDGNGGNLSARLGEFFLCTPTGVSKGFLRPEMLVLVDATGTQVAGTAPWHRTSEIHAHLAIYRSVPEAAAVVHAHPVHATAYAVAGQIPPAGMLTEAALFLGEIALAPYHLPGSPELGEALAPLAPRHQAILLAHHGAICWGASVEDAYFKMEILDSTCRTLALAAHLPGQRAALPVVEQEKLRTLRRQLGMPG